MIDITIESDPTQCRALWEQLIPQEQLTDLWDVRECFHKHYNRNLLFVIARDGTEIVGFLPLCHITEEDYYGYFPGETWQGKTWIEQNRVVAKNDNVLNQMLAWLDRENLRYDLRYLNGIGVSGESRLEEDEIGYLFLPKSYDYSMDKYYAVFNRKSIKSIRKEVDRYYNRSIDIRHNYLADFDQMIRLNIERFGSSSYFADNRFARSFKDLRDYLQFKNMLKITTVLIEGQIAAVDMGYVYNNQYTLIAGGTSENYSGIAKVINLIHITESCRQSYDSVDFLCGDFHWKKMFHLHPRPLFKISNLYQHACP